MLFNGSFKGAYTNAARSLYLETRSGSHGRKNGNSRPVFSLIAESTGRVLEKYPDWKEVWVVKYNADSSAVPSRGPRFSHIPDKKGRYHVY